MVWHARCWRCLPRVLTTAFPRLGVQPLLEPHADGGPVRQDSPRRPTLEPIDHLDGEGEDVLIGVRAGSCEVRPCAYEIFANAVEIDPHEEARLWRAGTDDHPAGAIRTADRSLRIEPEAGLVEAELNCRGASPKARTGAEGESTCSKTRKLRCCRTAKARPRLGDAFIGVVQPAEHRAGVDPTRIRTRRRP